ncbi:hypothetical protein [Salmonirosea aquatica]|uniref:Uncharacterized protein n=1 Tax=Salmonirosea aquatica TaxID=2654236 RepID=A0A7C9FSE3_9BACT|nr:hypothetical protein [Cytophagaceae bacterium SJW1-29]
MVTAAARYTGAGRRKHPHQPSEKISHSEIGAVYTNPVLLFPYLFSRISTKVVAATAVDRKTRMIYPGVCKGPVKDGQRNVKVAASAFRNDNYHTALEKRQSWRLILLRPTADSRHLPPQAGSVSA